MNRTALEEQFAVLEKRFRQLLGDMERLAELDGAQADTAHGAMVDAFAALEQGLDEVACVIPRCDFCGGVCRYSRLEAICPKCRDELTGWPTYDEMRREHS